MRYQKQQQSMIIQSEPSKLGLGITDVDLDTFSLGDEQEEAAFSTQISTANTSSLNERKMAAATKSNTSSQFVRKFKKEPSPVGQHPPEFYIGYLKSRVEREHERQRQLKENQSSRLIKTTCLVGHKGRETTVEPRTAYSSPDLSAPILRPLLSNRFRLKTQSSLNTRYI